MKKQYVAVSEKPLLYLLDGSIKEFYKAFFRLNLLLDIDIDEEDFQSPSGTIKDFRSDLEHIYSHVFGRDKYYKFSINTHLLRSALTELFYDIRKEINSRRGKHKSTKTSSPLDSNLHDQWNKFSKKIAVILKSSSKRTNSQYARRLLRLKGICLLLIVKYLRGMLYVDSLAEDLSKDQDAITRFASGSLSQIVSKTPESGYLQVLIFLECASCASPASSIGFLKLAESVAPEKAEDPNRNVFLNEIFPCYRPLLDYNYSIAYYHLGQRTEALDRAIWALGDIDRIINRSKLESIELTESEISDYRLYLEIPLLQLQADLFNKMQFCFNAIKTLQVLEDSAKKVEKMRRGNGEGSVGYKLIKAYLLEAACWLDMGDLPRSRHAMAKAARLGHRDRFRHYYLRHNIKTILKNIAKKDDRPVSLRSINNLISILSQRPNLHMEAINLILQYNLEVCRQRIIKNKEVPENDISLVLRQVKRLDKVIEVHRKDRFKRHNLKELAIDWLEILSAIKNVNIVNSGIVRSPLQSTIWRNTVFSTLHCIDNGMSTKKAISPYLQEGSVSNEIWGEHFKKIERPVRERMFGLIADLNDHCETFFHSKQHVMSESTCLYKDEKRFLTKIAKFELDSLGLEQKDNDVIFQDFKLRKDIYPKENTFEYRRTVRRGRLLLRYLDSSNNGKRTCNSANCFGHLSDSFTWLEKETEVDEAIEAGSISICLRRLNDAWGKEEIQKYKLRLSDYRNVIAKSDYTARLFACRSEQPVHLYKKQIKKQTKSITGVEFVTLRRWNSYTPELSFSKGGGYFVFAPVDKAEGTPKSLRGAYRNTRLGVVVDPGFDFIHNFFNQGFTLDDIDIVLITHADTDHINDFVGLMDLLRVRADRLDGPAKKIYAFMPLNARVVLERYISGGSYRLLYHDTILIDKTLSSSIDEVTLEHSQKNKVDALPRLRISTNGHVGRSHSISSSLKRSRLLVTIRPVMASHDDHTEREPGSYGYILSFQEQGRDYSTAIIGFTGDSQWFPEYAAEFKDCDLVCSHMGSIFGDKDENYRAEKQNIGHWESLIRKKNHPYLPGEVLFLEQLRKLGESSSQRIVVLSEFGEEMKGLMRRDLCERLNQCLDIKGQGCWQDFVQKGLPAGKPVDKRCIDCAKKRNGKFIRTIPADIGLRVSVLNKEKPRVHCIMCDHFGDPDDIEWVPYGSEEALFYVCGPCYRSTSQDVLTAKYKNHLEFGRPLE